MTLTHSIALVAFGFVLGCGYCTALPIIRQWVEARRRRRSGRLAKRNPR